VYAFHLKLHAALQFPHNNLYSIVVTGHTAAAVRLNLVGSHVQQHILLC